MSLHLAEVLGRDERREEALQSYQRLVTEFPAYPDLPAVERKTLELGR